jgi:hypothetical protein
MPRTRATTAGAPPPNKLDPGRALDSCEAVHAIGQFVRSRREMSPTPRQELFLKQRGQWREGMSRGEAFDLIGQLLAGTGGA